MADKSFWSDKKDRVWLKNFWYYYRVHVLVSIAVILVLVFTVRDCMLRIEPDISIDFIASSYITDEASTKIEEYFQPIIKDADGEDGQVVSFVQHNVIDTENGGDPQMAMAIQQAIMLELAVGESYLYILDDTHFGHFKDNEILLDLSEVTDLPEGTYSIDLQDNKLFSELTGVSYTEPLHLCVRVITQSIKEKDLPEMQTHQNNAISILNEFYKNE